MPQSKKPTEESTTDPAVDGAVSAQSSMAQALEDKKATVAKNRNHPPFPALRENHKAKRISNSPRNTRRSMGKR